MTFNVFSMATMAMLLVIGQQTHAGVTSKLAKEGARVLLRKGVQKTASQTAKKLATQSTTSLARKAATKAAQRSSASAARHFGDDLVRTGSTFSGQLARTSAKLTGLQQRRVAIMAKEMTKSGKTGMVSRLAAAPKPGSMVDDLWRLHKGKMAAGVAAGTVLIHGGDIARAGGEFIAKPLIDSAMQSIIAPVAKVVSITLVILMVAIGFAATCSVVVRMRLMGLLSSMRAMVAARLPFSPHRSR